jgi:hypothetical protein
MSRRRPSGGGGSSGGVRPGAGAAFGAAALVIERVEVRRNEQVLDLTHDAPLQIADGDRDLRIVARLLSFADSASAYLSLPPGRLRPGLGRSRPGR